MADVKQDHPRTIDSILELLGSLGRYQLFQALLLAIGNMSVCFHLLNFVFIAQTVKQQCEVTPLYGNNSNNTNYGTCDVSVQNTTTNVTSTHTCSAWTYDVQKDHSIVSEWDLVCGDVFFARLPQSLFIVGQGVGAATVSVMSDKFGRKPFLVVSHLLTAGAGLALAFSPNIAAFSALRLLNGIFQQGIVVCTYTMLMETFPRNRRIELSAFYTLSWSISTVLLTGTAYLLRDMDWRTLQLCFVSVSINVLLQIFIQAATNGRHLRRHSLPVSEWSKLCLTLESYKKALSQGSWVKFRKAHGTHISYSALSFTDYKCNPHTQTRSCLFM